MLIDDLAEHCNSLYINRLHGGGCNCTHPSECPGGCGKCLDQIHFSSNSADRVDYDCQSLVNFYVCRYLHKYASEVLYLLRDNKVLNRMNKYNVTSIGCGACSDFIAFDTFAGTKDFSYLGIDANQHWKDIHSFIFNNTSRYVKFTYNDALSCSGGEDCNVLVLNYVLSSVRKRGLIQAQNFCAGIVQRFITGVKNSSPFIIILNDINHSAVTALFSLFAWMIGSRSRKVNVIKGYFPHDSANKWGSCGLLYKIPSTINTYTYKIREYCTSAAMIIELS